MTPQGTPENHQAEARQEAVRRVRASLTDVDLALAASRGGLSVAADGGVELSLLGRSMHVAPGTLAVSADDGTRVSPVEELLVLRYLHVERAIVPTGQEVPFRDLPGGAFYHAALARRTTALLEKSFGDDAEQLRRALTQYPHESTNLGDVGARIHAVGPLDVVLIFRLADEEFPATAELLYDRIIASVYSPDEISALATHLCFGLLRPST